MSISRTVSTLPPEALSPALSERLVSCVRTQAACSDGASSCTRYAWRWLGLPRRGQLHQVRLALAGAARAAGEGEQADGAAFGIMDAMHEKLCRTQPLQFAREAAAAQGRRVGRA